jgi:hypothetical protein
LNETDPLGLSGGSQGFVNYLRAVAKEKKFCGTHRNANGCRGINVGHDIVSGLDKARRVAAVVAKKIKAHPAAAVGLVVGTALAVAPVPGLDVAGGELDVASAGDLGLDLGGTQSISTAVRAYAGLGLVLNETHSCAEGSAGGCLSATVGIGALANPIYEPAALSVSIADSLFDLAR